MRGLTKSKRSNQMSNFGSDPRMGWQPSRLTFLSDSATPPAPQLKDEGISETLAKNYHQIFLLLTRTIYGKDANSRENCRSVSPRRLFRRTVDPTRVHCSWLRDLSGALAPSRKTRVQRIRLRNCHQAHRPVPRSTDEYDHDLQGLPRPFRKGTYRKCWQRKRRARQSSGPLRHQ